MPKPNIDKIKSEVDKCVTPQEVIELYEKIKEHCTLKLVEAHKKHSDIAEDLISRIDKMNSGK